MCQSKEDDDIMCQRRTYWVSVKGQRGHSVCQSKDAKDIVCVSRRQGHFCVIERTRRIQCILKDDTDTE